MKARLVLSLALLFCTGAALAQTPDWETPATETICDSETGAAFGLCNAYCEAMDCETDSPQASATACTKVRDKFMNITGHDLPCETPACPCAAIPEWNAVLAGELLRCADIGSNIDVFTTTGVVAATDRLNPRSGGGCGVFSTNPRIILNITPEQGAACMDLLRTYCPIR